MGKRIAMIALLVLVLGGALLQSLYIGSTTDDLLGGLDAIKTALDIGDTPASIKAADTFCDRWNKEKKMYETLFEHDEVDIISATAKSIQSYCVSGDTAHALADIAAVRYYIDHIRELDRLAWKNIF